MRAYIFVLCWIGANFLEADAYKAAVVDFSSNAILDVLPFIHQAGEKIVKTLSKAAKQAGLYLVAHINENTVCQKKRELVRSNLVFDRQGVLVAVYKKPMANTANCSASLGSKTFDTDFGVTFDLMMEEDLVLKKPVSKNVVVVGAWNSEIPFLSAPQFTATWAYTANVNLLSRVGIFAGRAGLKTASGDLVFAELKNDAEESVTTPPVVSPATIRNFHVEDLSQYIFRALDVDASSRGLRETVCHNNFCCEFDVKTRYTESNQEVNYGLAAFDGIRHYSGRHYIGTQNCAVFACAGLYKRSCTIGSIGNNTNIVFEKLTVTANFTTENSIQYPVIVTNELLRADEFNFVTKSDKYSKQVTVEITHHSNLFAFGIFGRDFENDYENSSENQVGFQGIYNYIITEDLQELFDYLWIRLRILLFVVSIYVLEMM